LLVKFKNLSAEGRPFLLSPTRVLLLDLAGGLDSIQTPGLMDSYDSLLTFGVAGMIKYAYFESIPSA
jgi:hypothetical protein